ncbi:MAG: F0F1 ATP synthase subunit gamma [Myxococcales bacterium]|nr:MAG: F0F1 ATP synthase subunit gamma [Myxococcales bacterium]
MSISLSSLRNKISKAHELQSVVRAMKTIAAAHITQYEKSTQALSDYYRSIELSLGLLMRKNIKYHAKKSSLKNKKAGAGVIIFGSDQGLVGSFNEVISNFTIENINNFKSNAKIWVVGEHVQTHLKDMSIAIVKSFALPSSIQFITSLVANIIDETRRYLDQGEIDELFLFNNWADSDTTFTPKKLRLFPFDSKWLSERKKIAWPTKNYAEIVGNTDEFFKALLREYLFVSIFKACVESLHSENRNRIIAMQRADKNIDDMLKNLKNDFNHLRQSSIDEELFDVIAGFEAQRKL